MTNIWYKGTRTNMKQFHFKNCNTYDKNFEPLTKTQKFQKRKADSYVNVGNLFFLFVSKRTTCDIIHTCFKITSTMLTIWTLATERSPV